MREGVADEMLFAAMERFEEDVSPDEGPEDTDAPMLQA
jgi:hypothetical protein